MEIKYVLRKILVKTVVLFIIFIGSLYSINYISGIGKSETTAEMSKPTFPVVYTEFDDKLFNILYGYANTIDDNLMRESITPVYDRTISIVIRNFGNKVNNFRFEIRAVGDDKILQKGVVKELEKYDKGYKKGIINLTKGLNPEKEYSLKILITNENGININYYTRLKYVNENHLKDGADFIELLHSSFLDKEKALEVTKYLEPKSDVINNNLNSVNIYSSFEKVTWANLSPTVVTDIVPTIEEIDDSIISLKLEYVVSAQTSESVTEHYNITEFFRVKWTADRMYLLIYDRTQEEIFSHRLLDSSNNQFKIGISSYDVQYLTSSDCKKTLFVRENTLWYYDYTKTSITKVFSFVDDNLNDIRSNYNQHSIHLINMSDEGVITFTVYGYMNRGNHEGETGITLYRFYTEDSNLEELLFVPISQTYELMKSDIEKLMYLNSSNIFYFLESETLYSVDIDTKKVEIIVDEVDADSITVSEDHNIVAIQNNNNLLNSKKITIINLETQATNVIKAGKDNLIQNIGFVSNDLVYGIAEQSKVRLDDSGEIFFPMNHIYIVNFDKNKKQILKDYNKYNVYVKDAQINGNVIQLFRINGEYKEITEDSITSNKKSTTQLTFVYKYSTERYNELYMKFPSYIYATTIPKLKLAKETLIENVRTTPIETGDSKKLQYYVYAKGNLYGTYNKISDAITVADKQYGIVLNGTGKYVWEKSGQNLYATVGDVEIISSTNEISSKYACINMLLNFAEVKNKIKDYDSKGNTIEKILQSYLNENAVNLSGSDFNAVLYSITKGRPVIALNKDGNYILLTSYNSTTLRYIDTITGKSLTDDISKMKREFEEMGNVFYSYIE